MPKYFVLIFSFAVFFAHALPNKNPPPPPRPSTEAMGEFVASDIASLPRARNAFKIPLEPNFGRALFDATRFLARTRKALDQKKASPIKKLVKDKIFCTQALAVDAILCAGEKNLTDLAEKHNRYGNFLKMFFDDANFMRLFASVGMPIQDSSEAFRIMADIWATDGKASDFDARLCSAIAYSFALSPKFLFSAFATDATKIDPVWRYHFFKQFVKIPKDYPLWRLRFLVGVSCDDETLWFLHNRICLPPNEYENVFNAAPNSIYNAFGEMIDSPLYYAHIPLYMGDGEAIFLHGGGEDLRKELSVFSGAARGVITKQVENTREYKAAEKVFSDESKVRRGVVLRAFETVGVPSAGEILKKGWKELFEIDEYDLPFSENEEGEIE